MLITLDKVIFYSRGKTYESERADVKNWTIRILDRSELESLWNFKPKRIEIVKVGAKGREKFTRAIRDIQTLNEMLGHYLVGITWHEVQTPLEVS